LKKDEHKVKSSRLEKEVKKIECVGQIRVKESFENESKERRIAEKQE
jgi:hypothetical protein